ncbi:transposable element Tcb1 transposase [Trichonephila clavipes]|nr:transposable element Tcb1 transposase [Trichonephila clavipes]
MPLRRNRRQYEQLTDFDRGRIIGLTGWSNRRIGRHLGRSDMVVARCWQQWITEGRVYRRGGAKIHKETTVRSRRPLRRLPLTPHHRQCRLDFCRPRATWSVTDWRRVIFSDEFDDHPHVSGGAPASVVLQGTLTARRYVDDILTPIVLPMLSSRPGAIYQQDNARPHTARLSQQCLQGYDVQWPQVTRSFANKQTRLQPS